MIELPDEGCELNLSADRNWVRFIVDGKLIASFHVNYVNKVLATPEKAPVKKPRRKNIDLSPSL